MNFPKLIVRRKFINKFQQLAFYTFEEVEFVVKFHLLEFHFKYQHHLQIQTLEQTVFPRITPRESITKRKFQGTQLSFLKLLIILSEVW